MKKTNNYLTGTLNFALPSHLRSALAVFDDLGFDNAWQAAESILRHNDFAERWDMLVTAEREQLSNHLDTIRKWKMDTLKNNGITID